MNVRVGAFEEGWGRTLREDVGVNGGACENGDMFGTECLGEPD